MAPVIIQASERMAVIVQQSKYVYGESKTICFICKPVRWFCQILALQFGGQNFGKPNGTSIQLPFPRRNVERIRIDQNHVSGRTY